MSVKDIRSTLKQILAFIGAISSNTTTEGAVIDTAKFELGTMFSSLMSVRVDGTYNFILFESDVDTFGGEEVAILDGSDKLIGTLAGLQLVLATAEGGTLSTLGVISNKRFLRMDCVSTNVSTGATAMALVTEMGEEMPTV